MGLYRYAVTLSSAQPHPSGIINSIMVGLEETISMPLVVTEQGTIRIKGSRVSLDSIIHHFKLGATAEQIVQSFPSLSLCDVYSSIAYYLTHRQEIEEYLKEQETAADAIQEQLESNPDYQAEIAELRSRILGRWTASQENNGATPIG
jgi:uncharacterized protein (DUF433 family)